MKIKTLQDNILSFEDGQGNTVIEINGYHSSDCCEYNYIDFRGSLTDTIDLNKEYNHVYIAPQYPGKVYGFDLFLDGVRYPINCYSDQNGYYSSDLEITFIANKSIISEIKLEGLDGK